MRRLALLLGLLAAVACSGSSKKDTEDPDKWDMSDTDPAPKSGDDDDDDDSGGGTDPEPEPDGDGDQPKPVSRADDYEINEKDCDALALAYGRSWKGDELDKLNKRKLKQDQFDKAAAEIDSGAEEMTNNWRDECYKTVGTAYLRTRLSCALKAKSLERFNACMDGSADQ